MLLYLSAAEVSRDLKGELGLRGIEVSRLPVYRMAALDEFPARLRDAFAHDAIEAVLHYSRRSALAFVSAARRAGSGISALALPQVCLSDQIAAHLARGRRGPGDCRESAGREANCSTRWNRRCEFT